MIFVVLIYVMMFVLVEEIDCIKFNVFCGDCIEYMVCYWCFLIGKCNNYLGWMKIVFRDCFSKKWYYG